MFFSKSIDVNACMSCVARQELGSPQKNQPRSLIEWFRRIPEFFPFLGFHQPVLHFLLGKRGPLKAHGFWRSQFNPLLNNTN